MKKLGLVILVSLLIFTGCSLNKEKEKISSNKKNFSKVQSQNTKSKEKSNISKKVDLSQNSKKNKKDLSKKDYLNIALSITRNPRSISYDYKEIFSEGVGVKGEVLNRKASVKIDKNNRKYAKIEGKNDYINIIYLDDKNIYTNRGDAKYYYKIDSIPKEDNIPLMQIFGFSMKFPYDIYAEQYLKNAKLETENDKTKLIGRYKIKNMTSTYELEYHFINGGLDEIISTTYNEQGQKMFILIYTNIENFDKNIEKPQVTNDPKQANIYNKQ